MHSSADINGDGLQDLFVGAPRMEDGEGRVLLLFLTPGGQLQTFTMISPDLTAYPHLQVPHSSPPLTLANINPLSMNHNPSATFIHCFLN